MKRYALRILLLMLLGVVTSVGVAWHVRGQLSVIGYQFVIPAPPDSRESTGA